MSIDFKTFVEVQDSDGYWQEVNAGFDTSFLCSYCDGYDGYINEDLYIGLFNMSDGYFSLMFKRPFPKNTSTTVSYKMEMLNCVGYTTFYYFLVSELNLFDWTRAVYGSGTTSVTLFSDIGQDFMNNYLPLLNTLGPPAQVRLIVLKRE